MAIRRTTRVIAIAVLLGVASVADVYAGEGPSASQPSAPPAPERAAGSLILDCGHGVKMELALVPAGTFTMGADDDSDDQKPPHPVTISRPFYMGKHEVTQRQWRAVMGGNPSHFQGDGLPVEQISWDDCQGFCTKLSTKTGRTVRLPTEAEWEYACRAGSTGNHCFGDSTEGLEAYAWYDMNSALVTHPVGLKKPNAWGLYDMHGNVWEWCADWDGKYVPGAVTDPMGPPSGAMRVVRGGSWACDQRLCRSAFRLNDSPDSSNKLLGFRVVIGEPLTAPRPDTSAPERRPARPFEPKDAGSRQYEVASAQQTGAGAPRPPQNQPTAPTEPLSKPPAAKSKLVTVNISGPAIGRAPYWVGYSVADLPADVAQNADFLWMDNGVWIGDQPRGAKILETPGRHEITVLVVTRNNEEYRGRVVVEVMQPLPEVPDGSPPPPTTSPASN